MANLFETQLSRGKVGEEFFIETMKERGNLVEDLRDKKEYQKQDIDFRIQNPEGKFTLVEVKTDYRMNQTGNIFLERVIEYREGNEALGWFAYTRADYLAFVDGITKEIYIYQTAALKEWINKHSPYMRRCNDGYKTVYGYCVPKNVALHQKI
jgi:hypothetical protein